MRGLYCGHVVGASRVNISSRQSAPPGEHGVGRTTPYVPGSAGVSAVDPDGLPGGGFGLAHSAFDAVGHEVDRRVGARPSGGNAVGDVAVEFMDIIAITFAIVMFLS